MTRLYEKFFGLLGVLVPCMLVSCAQHTSQSNPAQQKQVSATRPVFRLDEQPRRALIDAAKQVKPGDSYEETMKRMGATTYDDHVYPEGTMKFWAYVHTWCLTIWDSNAQDTRDEVITIYFDVDIKNKKSSVHAVFINTKELQ